MKLSEAVMDAMSYIDESYLRQSEEEKTRFSWKPVLAFAAVFSLVMAAILYMPRSGSASPAFNGMYSTDSAIPEEDITDGIADQVLYDEDLLDYLETVSSDTAVCVTIEVVSANAAQTAGSVSENLEMDDKEAEVTEETEAVYMTKEEILGFEPEPGVNYIFHLQNADDME